MKKILILFSYKKNKLADYDDLIRELQKNSKRISYAPERGAIKEMEFSVIDNTPKIFEPLTGRDLADNDLIFFRMWLKEAERATTAAVYLRSKGVKFIDDDVYSHRAMSKLTETFNMAIAGLPVPNTYFSKAVTTLKRFKTEPPFGFPVVVKSIRGLKGKDNYLANGYDQLAKTIKSNPEIDFMVQEYIPNDYDYRLWVLGDEVRLVLKRTRQNGATHLNNISQGAKGELVKPSTLKPRIIRQAVKASQIMHRNFTGVDVLVDKHTGKYYFLEVNNIPEIISVFADEKIQVLDKYLNEILEQGKSRLNSNKKVIGRLITVDFPELNLHNVLAKIDTGAYRGTIHCTDVKVIEKNGVKVLSFVPLDLRHPDYSHKAVQMHDFALTTVKQTNGHKQQRYVIKTKIRLDGKVYPIEISLSDRTDMRSPVLIGRRFLRGKFIVDVQA